jgi:xanthine/CO dehydrogenase XdhC/CoxF family maturation factor
LFFEMSIPAQELVVFGAGPDAAPLAQHAWALGFSVTMVDVRTAYLTKERFPTAKLVLAHFSQFATAVPLAPGSFVIVMNHHLERDEESLRYALRCCVLYRGAWAAGALRKTAGRSGGAGLYAVLFQVGSRAQPSRPVDRR